ncbi:MAG: UvrB/UvrC motif-containing protein [Patescibacteria group bacterium]
MKFRYITKEEMIEIPKAPGVYSFAALRGAQGKAILYIGKAANLRERVKNHFHQPSYRDDLFIDQVERVGYIETESEIEALLLESQLIKKDLPKYNVMWKDGKQYLFVGMSAEELPRIFFTHQPANEKIQNTTYIGPFTDGKALKRTLRNLRRVFPYYTVKKHGSKPCQYCHLGLCPGPAPNKKEYQKSIRNLVALLEGKKPAVLKKLQKEMNAASKNQEYEKAGRLRDQMRDLEIIFSHAKVLRVSEEKTSINWAETEKYLQKILATKQKISRVEAYDISNIQGKEATGSMPVFINGKPTKEHYRKFKIRLAGMPNDFAMLQEVITRRLAHAEWPYPDLMIIDGGKPQLSAALAALQTKNYKLPTIKLAAIAKKHNELFLPGKSKPFLLKDMPQSVSNFILYIRDEAHRFAIIYHRKLRKVDLLGKKK